MSSACCCSWDKRRDEGRGGEKREDQGRVVDRGRAALGPAKRHAKCAKRTLQDAVADVTLPGLSSQMRIKGRWRELQGMVSQATCVACSFSSQAATAACLYCTLNSLAVVGWRLVVSCQKSSHSGSISNYVSTHQARQHVPPNPLTERGLCIVICLQLSPAVAIVYTTYVWVSLVCVCVCVCA